MFPSVPLGTRRWAGEASRPALASPVDSCPEQAFVAVDQAWSLSIYHRLTLFFCLGAALLLFVGPLRICSEWSQSSTAPASSHRGQSLQGVPPPGKRMTRNSGWTCSWQLATQRICSLQLILELALRSLGHCGTAPPGYRQ